MQKGITPVIAIILLLVITIAIAGFSFVIFQKNLVMLGNQAQNQTEETINRLSGCIRTESFSGSTIYVRNCGTTPLDPQVLSVYANNIPLSVTPGSSIIQPGQTGAVPINFGSLQPGVYDIELKSASGMSSTLRSVSIQSNPTAITLIAPPDSQQYPSGTTQATLDCSASDPDGINILEFYTSFGGWSLKSSCNNGDACDTDPSSGVHATFDQQGLSDGSSYYWNCHALDSSSNEAWGIQRTFSVLSVTIPSIFLNTPPDNQQYSSGTTQVVLDCSASDPDNISIEFYTSFGGWSLKSTCSDGAACDTDPAVNSVHSIFTQTGLSDGSYTWNCHGIDSLGYDAWGTQRSFVVGGLNILLSYPANGATLPGTEPVNVTCIASDNARVDKVELFMKKDSGPFEQKSTNYPYKKNLLAPNADFEFPNFNRTNNIYNETAWPRIKNVSSTPLGLHGKGALMSIANANSYTEIIRYLTPTWDRTAPPNQPSILSTYKTYYASGYVTVPFSTTTLTIRINNGQDTMFTNEIKGSTAGWQRFNITFQTGSYISTASINISLNGTAGDYAIIDEIQIEELEYTNFTDDRLVLAYEETNDTCDTPTQCEGVKNVTVLSNIVSETLDDGMWSNSTDTTKYDKDYLTCGNNEECRGFHMRIDTIDNGVYEIIIYNPICSSANQFLSTDNITWYQFALPGTCTGTNIAVVNVSVVGNSLDIYINKTLTGLMTYSVNIDRIVLKPQVTSQFTSSFAQYTTPGSYTWNCRATDDSGIQSFATSNYTFTIT